MAWTTPRTWAVGEAITADLLNEQLRDNLAELKDPPSANYELNEASDYTTTSTSFVDVDATSGKLSLTITTNGGDVLVHFEGAIAINSSNKVYLEIDIDGVPVGGDDGINVGKHGINPHVVSFTRLITGLSTGSHTFKLQWKVSAGTATLYAGAGTLGLDVHPQFWVRELS
jgi:hypothetical protein